MTQPRTFRVYDSYSRKKETYQLRVQSRTGTINPDISPEDKTSMPSANQIIEDVPDMIYKEKTGNNPSKSSTSGKDVDSRYLGGRM